MTRASDDEVAGRSYPRIYRVSGKKSIHEMISRAIEAGGGRVLYASHHTRAPFYFGVETAVRERLGLLIYPFSVNSRLVANRPPDEHRGHLRYGAEETWYSDDHHLAFDRAGVDTTLVLGVNVEDNYFLGLDPGVWSPLPMGISFFARDADVDAMDGDGWHVWEKQSRDGARRDARAPLGLETKVAFRPQRLLDYARFERDATDLGLDTSLRYSAAVEYKKLDPEREFSAKHVLEDQFDLTSRQILEIIATRTRLAVAVRGGVAEHHLERQFLSDSKIIKTQRRDKDGEPDFDVELDDGRDFVIECKNVSPKRYKDETIKIEVQKTRASKGDPASRYYRYTEFSVVAACLFSATGRWEFKYALSRDLTAHAEYSDRLAPLQRVDGRWKDSLHELG